MQIKISKKNPTPILSKRIGTITITFKFTSFQCFLKWTPDQFAIGDTADNLDTVLFFKNLNEILLSDGTNYGVCEYQNCFSFLIEIID